MWPWILAAELLYAYVAWRDWTNGWPDVLLFVGIFAVQFAILYFAPRPTRARTVLLTAVLFRVTLLPAGCHDGEWQRFLLYDSDIWRYLWDGHVTRSGVSPYAAPPPRLDGLAADDPYWSAVRDNINYRDIPTIYPPAAQLVFAVVPGTVLSLKFAFVLFDLLTLHFLIRTLQLLGRPVADAVWWAWNPLVIKVFAGSGHVDSIACAALAGLFYALARQHRAGTSAAFLIAVLSKWSPLALAPLLWRRLHPAIWILALAAAAIPGIFGGLQAFATFWQFNSLVSILPVLKLPLALAAMLLIAIVAFRVPKDATVEYLARQSGYILGAVVVCSPAVMPWYVTWLLPGAILSRNRVWLAFSALVFLAFFVMADGQQRWYIVASEYAALAAIFWWEHRSRHEKNNSGILVDDRSSLGAG